MNAQGIIASYHSQRARAFLKKVMATCDNRGLPQELSLPFARGYLILDGHRRYLAESGQTLLETARTIESLVEQGAPQEELTGRLEEIILTLPNRANPKVEIWQLPSKEEINAWGFRKQYIIVVDGCSDPCLFCCVAAPAKSVSMPFPVILGGHELGLRLDWSHSEPFYYFDPYFNLDFVDLVQEFEFPYEWLANQIFTHGTPLLTKQGLSVAQKARAIELPVERLSIHLWHKGLIPEAVGQAPNDYQLERYAKMFAQALEYFQPRILHFIASDRAVHQCLSFPFLIGFHEERVLSKVSRELRIKYSLANFAPAHAPVIRPTVDDFSIYQNEAPFVIRSVEYIRRERASLVTGPILELQKQARPEGAIEFADRFGPCGIYPDGLVRQYPGGIVGNWF